MKCQREDVGTQATQGKEGSKYHGHDLNSSTTVKGSSDGSRVRTMRNHNLETTAQQRHQDVGTQATRGKGPNSNDPLRGRNSKPRKI